MFEIHGVVNAEIVGPGFTDGPGDPHTGKPYLQLTFGQQQVVCITANVAEMIGGIGRGVNARISGAESGSGGIIDLDEV